MGPYDELHGRAVAQEVHYLVGIISHYDGAGRSARRCSLGERALRREALLGRDRSTSSSASPSGSDDRPSPRGSSADSSESESEGWYDGERPPQYYMSP